MSHHIDCASPSTVLVRKLLVRLSILPARSKSGTWKSAVLMTTHWGSKVKIWNTESRCLTSEFAAEGATFTAIGIRSHFDEVIVGDLVGSHNLWGNFLQPLDIAASSSWNNTVLALHQQVQVHLGAVESICISNDGTKLVSGSSDCTIAMTEMP
jgi:WD40 repeat protein